MNAETGLTRNTGEAIQIGADADVMFSFVDKDGGWWIMIKKDITDAAAGRRLIFVLYGPDHKEVALPAGVAVGIAVYDPASNAIWFGSYARGRTIREYKRYAIRESAEPDDASTSSRFALVEDPALLDEKTTLFVGRGAYDEPIFVTTTKPLVYQYYIESKDAPGRWGLSPYPENTVFIRNIEIAFSDDYRASLREIPSELSLVRDANDLRVIPTHRIWKNFLGRQPFVKEFLPGTFRYIPEETRNVIRTLLVARERGAPLIGLVPSSVLLLMLAFVHRSALGF